MPIEELVVDIVVGGVIAAFALASISFILIMTFGVYIYLSMSWMTIAKKLKSKRWFLAWIPFARTGLVLKLDGFHWAWAFLYLVPVIGWFALLIITIVAKWRIFEKRKFPGWLALFILIPQAGIIAHAIILGFVAWGKK